MNTDKLLRVEKKGEIGIITLDSPGRLNILDTALLRDLRDSLTTIEKDREVRVVILTGNGNFCAGADIKEMKGKSPEEAEAFSRLGHTVFSLIEDMGKAVIAAVSGYALGGGCELAISCDIRMAAANARFGQPELNLGLIPGFGATQRLPRLVGMGKAKEMLLTGRIIDADEAVSCGLADSIVNEADLYEKSMDMAKAIAQKGPLAVKKVKILLNNAPGIEEGIEREIRSFTECFATKDLEEGMKAFLEKRKPRFSGI
ncbi:MAG TPA: enoyl-CoA hydratase-related protein [Thermodesulfovibrionales bacterium]|nr:enoyl-CoA hydratase-related protein [Thermodesulfovibrionales bacterium]